MNRASLIWANKHWIVLQTQVLILVLLGSTLNLSPLYLCTWWQVLIALLPFHRASISLEKDYKRKSAFGNWNTLDMCKERSNSFQQLSLKSSHIYCSPELLWKRQTVINSNGVLQRANLFLFQFKALEAANFQSRHCPWLRLSVSPIYEVSIYKDPLRLSASNHQNVKANGEMTYFTWTLQEALENEAMWSHDRLITQALGHHVPPARLCPVGQSFLCTPQSGSVCWGLSLNWAWDRGPGMIE